ncbi:MAG: 6,7-dimethyl-8-ribityllumazine synthase [Promicromonosporaceae bacterium]|nr:6,7-dimethyl-8-ribityllumazine synthase [Promicromonosporaceae bacterium]
MAGTGAPTPEFDPRIAGRLPSLRVAVIAASWHTQVMEGLLDGTRRALALAQVTEVTEYRVPGTFELTVAAARAAESGKYDAIVALGVVIRGDTPHFEYVCQGATHGLTNVAVSTGIPVGFGVLTCDSEGQAIARAGLPGSIEDKGFEATQAALTTAVVLRNLPLPTRPIG